MQCFVCSEQLVGDSQYIEHHINSCLDRQGSSSQPLADPHVTPTAVGVSRHDAFTASPCLQPGSSGGSAGVDADHALAPALAQAEDGDAGTGLAKDGLGGRSFNGDATEQDRLLALTLAREEEGRLAGVSTGAEGNALDVCPSCSALWADLNLSFAPNASFLRRSETIAQRTNHSEKCKGRKERYMSWSPAVGTEEHGKADLDDEMAEEAGRSLAGGKGKKPPSGPFVGGAKGLVTGTAGMVVLLHHALSASHASPHGRTREAYLANERTEHIATSYKNAQMVFSAFRHLPQYAQGSTTAAHDTTPIPPIRTWQETIEQAWKEGYDADGAEHFGGRLIGSRKWIGTTEVYTALTYMGVNAVIVDFPKSEPGSGVVTNKALVKWILDYFRSPSSPASSFSSAQGAPTNAFALLSASQGTSIHLTGKQPLYLQHKGHSRTVVGVEVGKSVNAGAGAGGRGRAASEGEEEVWLLVFDPGRPITNDIKNAAASFEPASPASPAASSTMTDNTSVSSGPSHLPPFKKFKPSRGGFGLSSSPKKAKNGSGSTMPKFSDVLKCVRVNMNDLKKKDEYQILYITAADPPLTEDEKQIRKLVSAQLGVPKEAVVKKK
ncbi:zinc finger with UFM1-specific peptidase domain protein [Rhodotorula toruloides]|uniref:Zinc finger with UFM1-specific peptidase domain protein n=1 Tax=Rhodotorula toruloides TaxID=5286 RepID=A0A511KNS1_RHOTO|nr:zinc finger with UFM1-specific peptidase domain protein [Rhodotorula toruloides]